MSVEYKRKSNNNVINSILMILDKITGIHWGFARTSGGKAVQYLTSVEFPVRIFVHIVGVRRRKRPAATPLDAEITIRAPAEYRSVAEWSAAVGSTLRVLLLKNMPPAAIAERLVAVPGDKYSAAAAESDRCWAEFYKKYEYEEPETDKSRLEEFLETHHPVDVYTEECAKYPLC